MKNEAVRLLLLQNAAKERFVSKGTIASEFEEELRMMSDLGLLRRVTVPEGVAYEITDAGLQFLEQYRDLEPDALEKADHVRDRLKDQVTVVIPTLNESEAITRVIEEVAREGYDNILVVDGYSTDNTTQKTEMMGIKVIHQLGSGKAGAIKTAIREVQTPFMLFMDGDCTYDPKDIGRLMSHSNLYAHIIGVRDGKSIGRVHRFGNWVICRAFNLLFGVRASDVCSGMYLLKTDEVRKYNIEARGFSVEIELAAQSAARGSLAEVPIHYGPRIGAGKLKTRDGFAILSAVFTLARRYNPILLYSSLAGLSVIPAVLILGWVGFQQLFARVWHSGWALVGTLFLLVAAQAVTLASVSILTKHTEERILHELENIG